MGIHPCSPRCQWEFVRSGRLVFVQPYVLASFRAKKRGLIAAIKAFRVVSFRGRARYAPGPGCNDEPRGKKKGRARTRRESNTRDSPSRIGWPTPERRHGILGCASQTIETRGTNARYNVNGKNADRPTAVRRGARNFCRDKNQWNKPLPRASVHGKTANRDTEADLLSGRACLVALAPQLHDCRFVVFERRRRNYGQLPLSWEWYSFAVCYSDASNRWMFRHYRQNYRVLQELDETVIK